jgi:lysophospholipase L1-like esterase
MKHSLLIFLLSVLAITTTQCRKSEALYFNNSSDSTINQVIINPPGDSPKTFLALGDSYTIGQSVLVTERFPAQVSALLRTAGFNIQEPRYIATTGWTTNNLKNAINTQQPRGPFNLVTLLIGVNDQYQTHDTTGYRERFRDLLNTAINLAGGNRNRVFVLSIPDYSVTPFAASSDTAQIRKEIDWFNDINRAVTAEATCSYTDITPSTRESANDLTLLATDGLHPSGKEYNKWAIKLFPLMRQVL